jgi:hypothetical protein
VDQSIAKHLPGSIAPPPNRRVVRAVVGGEVCVNQKGQSHGPVWFDLQHDWSTRVTGQFAHDVPQGSWHRWVRHQGTFRHAGHFSFRDGEHHGVHVHGDPALAWGVLGYFRDGEEHGPSWGWGFGGATMNHGRFDRGKRVGRWQLGREIFYYQGGKIHGPYRRYRRDGSIEWSGRYTRGFRTGRWQKFDHGRKAKHHDYPTTPP